MLLEGKDYNCKDIPIPEGVTEIKPLTFSGMTMYYVTVPKETTKIAANAFIDSQNMEKLNIAAENANYESKLEGLLVIEKASKTVIFGGRGGEFNLSDLDIVAIGDHAFHSRSIKYITLPNTVKKIGYQAFYSCSTPTMNIGNAVEEIGSQAFANNKNIKSIDLPATLNKIGSSIFMGCGALTSVNVGSPSNWEYLNYDDTYLSVDESNLSTPSAAASYLKSNTQMRKK